MLMTWFVGIIILIFLVCIGCVAGHERKVQKDGLWGSAAAALGGTYDSKAEEIHYTVLDRPALLREEVEEEGGRVSFVDVDLRGCSSGVIIIARAGFASDIARLFGAKHIEDGDRAFDSQLVVKSDPESLALKVFAPDRRTEIARAFRELSVDSIHLNAERLRLIFDGSLSTEKTIHDLARVAHLVLEGILGKGVPEQAYGVLEIEPIRGCCFVCRSGMRESVVLCKQCQTPHHEECWQLIRKCSTFGCHEPHFVVSTGSHDPAGNSE